MRTVVTGTVAIGSSAEAMCAVGAHTSSSSESDLRHRAGNFFDLPEPQPDRVALGEELRAGLPANSGSMSAFMQIRFSGKAASSGLPVV